MARFGAFLRDVFGGGRQDPETVARVKRFARAALGGDDTIALSVNEIACTDPACPGVETVILVMRPGRKTRAVKIGKAIDSVTEEDVRDALADGDGATG